MVPRNEHKIREKIIETAIQLVPKNGFNKLKFSDLSKQAKISVVTIRKYFPSKDEILTAAFQFIWEKIMKDVVAEHLKVICYDEEEEIRELFKIVVGYFMAEKNKNEAYVSLFECRNKDFLNHLDDSSAFYKFFEFINSLFRSAQKKGVFQNDLRVEDMVTVAWYVSEGCLYRNYVHKHQNEFKGAARKRAVDYNLESAWKLFEKVLHSFRTDN